MFYFSFILFPKWFSTWNWGNVADWVSGVGSLGAIIFVYIQIRESQRQSEQQIDASRSQLDEQLNAERERGFQQERPLFKILKIDNVSMEDILQNSKTDDYYVPTGTNNGEYIAHSKDGVFDKKNYHYFFLKNISDKRMLGVRVLFLYKNNISQKDYLHYFYIDTINGDKKVNLFDYFLINGDDKKLNRIEVAFNTNMRELLNVVFEIDGNDTPDYKRSLSYIENKDGKTNKEKIPEFYNLNDFKESEIL